MISQGRAAGSRRCRAASTSRRRIGHEGRTAKVSEVESADIQARLRAIAARARKASAAEALPVDTARFVRQYYAQAEPEELAERPAALAAAALDHLRWAAERQPGRAKVRVFNPVAAEHGYTSERTVVETVNDDMPFLVDSLTM